MARETNQAQRWRCDRCNCEETHECIGSPEWIGGLAGPFMPGGYKRTRECTECRKKRRKPQAIETCEVLYSDLKKLADHVRSAELRANHLRKMLAMLRDGATNVLAGKDVEIRSTE